MSKIKVTLLDKEHEVVASKVTEFDDIMDVEVLVHNGRYYRYGLNNNKASEAKFTEVNLVEFNSLPDSV